MGRGNRSVLTALPVRMRIIVQVLFQFTYLLRTIYNLFKCQLLWGRGRSIILLIISFYGGRGLPSVECFGHHRRLHAPLSFAFGRHETVPLIG